MTKGPTNNSEIIDLVVGASTGCQCNDWVQNPNAGLGLGVNLSFCQNVPQLSQFVYF